MLTLKVKKLSTTPRIVKRIIFNQKNGVLRSWPMKVKGDIGESASIGDAELILGDHETADLLRSLDLNLQSIWCRFGTKLQAIGGPPQNLEKVL